MSTHPWHGLPNNPDHAAQAFNVVIEIPRGSKVKYELDKPTGLLRVDRVLYSAVHYPANYGFLPRTYCEDGDPLDVLVLGSEPVVPLSIMEARAIGAFRMLDEGRPDDKVVAVHINDPSVNSFRDIGDVPTHIFREIERFFEDYKKLENKKVQVGELTGAEGAVQIVVDAIQLYRDKEQQLRGWH